MRGEIKMRERKRKKVERENFRTLFYFIKV